MQNLCRNPYLTQSPITRVRSLALLTLVTRRGSLRCRYLVLMASIFATLFTMQTIAQPVPTNLVSVERAVTVASRYLINGNIESLIVRGWQAATVCPSRPSTSRIQRRFQMYPKPSAICRRPSASRFAPFIGSGLVYGC